MWHVILLVKMDAWTKRSCLKMVRCSAYSVWSGATGDGQPQVEWGHQRPNHHLRFHDLAFFLFFLCFPESIAFAHVFICFHFHDFYEFLGECWQAEMEATIPGATHSAMAVRGVGSCGKALVPRLETQGCQSNMPTFTRSKLSPWR